MSSIAVRSLATYADNKLAAKESRRTKWKEKQEQKSRLETRRAGRPTKGKRNEFRDWFDNKKAYHEILDKKARREGLPWIIRAAVVIERLPTELPEMEKWESDYVELSDYLESFDFDYPEQLVTRDKNIYAYDDIEDKAVDENLTTTAASEEESDDSENIMSLDRKMETKLYFALRKEEKAIWEFPSVELRDGETLREGAERIAASLLGEETSLISFTNCPIGVTMQQTNDNKEFYGTKTFFMKLQYEEGNVKEMNDVHSCGWLDRSELSDDALSKEDSRTAKLYHYML